MTKEQALRCYAAMVDTLDISNVDLLLKNKPHIYRFGNFMEANRGKNA